MSHSAAETIKTQQSIYEASGVVYREAELDDNATIKSVLRENSMDSWVTLSTEHEPCYFDSNNLFGTTQTILACEDDITHSVIGVCSSVVMPIHINGKTINAGYLGSLRVEPAFRHKMSVLRNGFKSIRTLTEIEQELPYWFTSIAKENSAARRLLEANLRGMPVYRPLGELQTIALSTRLGKKSTLLQYAQNEDIPALAQFYNQQASGYQYSPVITEQWLKGLDGKNGLCLRDFWLLKEEGVIRACFALWDQRKIKQTVVRGYRFPLNIFRQAYNLYAGLSGRVALPACGEKIDYVFIAFLAIDNAAQPETETIIRSALSLIKERAAKMAMLGLSTKSPLLQYLESLPGQIYSTCIESVTWSDQAKKSFEPLPIQPEIAIL